MSSSRDVNTPPAGEGSSGRERFKGGRTVPSYGLSWPQKTRVHSGSFRTKRACSPHKKSGLERCQPNPPSSRTRTVLCLKWPTEVTFQKWTSPSPHLPQFPTPGVSSRQNPSVVVDTRLPVPLLYYEGPRPLGPDSSPGRPGTVPPESLPYRRREENRLGTVSTSCHSLTTPRPTSGPRGPSPHSTQTLSTIVDRWILQFSSETLSFPSSSCLPGLTKERTKRCVTDGTKETDGTQEETVMVECVDIPSNT